MLGGDGGVSRAGKLGIIPSTELGDGSSPWALSSRLPDRLNVRSLDMTTSNAFGKSEMLPAKSYVGKQPII